MVYKEKKVGRNKKLEGGNIIALSGLLHDIGKFLQRAKNKGFRFSDDSVKDPGNDWNNADIKNEFIYEHAFLTKIFVEFLRDIEIIDKDTAQKLIEWGARHHNPTDELESIVMQIADWYSSSEREADLGSCINLLHSVFERISLKPVNVKKESFESLKTWKISEKEKFDCSKLFTHSLLNERSFIKRHGYYKIAPLRIEEEIFPVVFDGVTFLGESNGNYELLIVPKDKKIVDHAKVEEDGYKKQFKEFINEILKAKSLKGEQLFNYIYYLMYKYTWCIPASTWDSEKASRHYPDISLFDHSRVLSAIAVALYDWAYKEINNGTIRTEDLKPKENGELYTDNKEVFLLVEGDIGGIQKFIYSIHKASESELSIAKALRGRSFFLTMLPEIIARYILRKLGYPITNALYIGGGKFQLLLGNIKSNVDNITEIEKEINEWMFKEFQGELSLSVAYIPMKGSALRNREHGSGKETYLDHVEKLQIELDKKKKRKLGELIYREFENDIKGSADICPSCRSLKAEEREIGEEKISLCKWCWYSQRWGEILPKIRYIAFFFNDQEKNIDMDDDRKVVDFGNFGTIYLLEEKDLSKIKDLSEILNIEDTYFKISDDKVVNGFKFIGHSAPKRGNEIITFQELSRFAEGDEKLGFLRADVDYLGLILSDGLRFDEKGDKEIYTISRIATLSRMLDIFFTGYLNKMAEKVSIEYVEQRFNKLEKIKEEGKEIDEEEYRLFEEIRKNNKLKIGSLIYTVYAGGDDLFIIAPYDLAVKFAIELRRKFSEYTCFNNDFGISGGIFIGRHNTPIHLVAEFTESLEKQAKNLRMEKDAISIFDKAFPWNGETLKEKGISYCRYKNEEDESELITFDEILRFQGKIMKYLEESKFGRGFLYKLLYLYKQYCNNGNSVDMRIYPKIYYQLGRNVKEDVRKELADSLLNGMGGKFKANTVIKNLSVAISLVLMKTRKGGG